MSTFFFVLVVLKLQYFAITSAPCKNVTGFCQVREASKCTCIWLLLLILLLSAVKIEQCKFVQKYAIQFSVNLFVAGQVV